MYVFLLIDWLQLWTEEHNELITNLFACKVKCTQNGKSKDVNMSVFNIVK